MDAKRVVTGVKQGTLQKRPHLAVTKGTILSQRGDFHYLRDFSNLDLKT
jgi:hypothetical protein